MPSNMMVKCAKCGFENETGHIYCAKCKTKLNLDQISSESFLKSGKHRDFRLQILQVILLVFIICFAFALWPVPIDAVKTSGLEFGRARNKLTQLQQGVLTEPAKFSENEVNMLFNHLLQENRRRPDSEAGSIFVSDSQVRINEDTLTINLSYQVGPWMLGLLTTGPFWLTYEVTGRPEPGPGGLCFSALSGGMGHLPLPFLGGHLGNTRLQQIFVPFKNAQVFLSRLEIVEIRKGSIKVKYSK